MMLQSLMTTLNTQHEEQDSTFDDVCHMVMLVISSMPPQQQAMLRYLVNMVLQDDDESITCTL